jgi:3',5'-nucleoside bisphosphate phosphatase
MRIDRLKLPIRLLLPLLLAAAQLPAQATRQHRPTPNVGEFHVLKADLHTHTVFSDGLVWPSTRVREAWAEDLDVLSITDHDDYRPHKQDVSTDLSRPWELAKPLADSLGLILVPGVEITKGDIHFNALFVTDFNAFTGLELQSALAEAKRQGAFSFWNHPGWRGKAQWFPPIATAYSDKLFQGIELVNGPSYYEEAHPWVGQYNLTILGTSDIHGPSLPGEPRSLTLLLVRERTLAGIREALDTGRTVAWQHRRLFGNERILADLFRAYVQAPAELRLAPGARGALALRNNSALTFEIKAAAAPAYMEVSAVTVPPQSTVLVPVRLKPDAPKTRQKVTLRVEVGNALVGPNQPLTVPLEFQLIP